MKVVGCDLHAKQQSIAMVNTETGASAIELPDIQERRSSKGFRSVLSNRLRTLKGNFTMQPVVE